MKYFALNEDGLLYDLGDHGDWEAANYTAEDMKLNAIWLFDADTAENWAGFINDSLAERGVQWEL